MERRTSPRYASKLLDPYGDQDDEMPGIVETIASEWNGCMSDSPMAIRPTGQQASIALCMIVRDEAAVITRCLQSVRPLIDAWVICDTGSRDGTPQLVERLLEGIPGMLHHRPWRDFGWNRSELMSLTAGAADYLLLLDADMTLDYRGPLPRLRADAYLIGHAGELAYRVPRLVRGDRRWWFQGSTHEHLAGEGQWSEEVLEALVVQHHGDGSSRAHKLQRDVILLERDLRTDPENDRATFYLAQTLRDLGEEERAIGLYERRVELGGWDQERFYAAYQAGSLRARRDEEGAVGALLRAWQLQPQRAEPLWELTRFCRFRAWHEAAYLFASRAVELPYPDDGLFVHRWVYEWGVRFELAMAAYWVGATEQALALIDSLLADGRLPAAFSEAAWETRAYCSARVAPSRTPRHAGPRDAVPLLKDSAPSFEVAEIRLDVDPAWPQFNPTIACDGDGYRLIVRTANYQLGDEGYRFLSDENVVRTLNYMVTLDRQLEVTGVAPLQDRSNGPQRYPSRFQGYEDCRLFSFGGNWFASATVRDRNPLERCEMALLTLHESEITTVTMLRTPVATDHEKNWMPLATEWGLRFVYSCNPTIVVQCDPETGLCSLLANHPGPSALELRGSSQGVRIEDGFLFLVHEVSEHHGRRTYEHRFVMLDCDHRLAASSSPFAFVSRESEFCAGLARRDDELLVTFGVRDHAAMLAVVDDREVLAMLEPADPLQTVPPRVG